MQKTLRTATEKLMLYIFNNDEWEKIISIEQIKFLLKITGIVLSSNKLGFAQTNKKEKQKRLIK